MTEQNQPMTLTQLCGWVVVGVFLILVVQLNLLAALLAGLLVYELTSLLVGVIQRRWTNPSGAKLLAVALMAALIIGLLILAGVGIVAYLQSGSIPALFKKMAEIIEGARDVVPPAFWEYIPADTEELQAAVVQWLRDNAGLLQGAGAGIGRVFAYILIGMVVGALLSLEEIVRPEQYLQPMTRALVERVTRLRMAFRNIVLAQARIAAINAFFTWLYLGVALPLFGVELPLVKTMVAITFVVGLLPVVGNLISNTVIVVISLSHSVLIACVSLTYLVVIHKLEYFLNAHIIGSRIHAQAWELLLAMLIMEAAFGIPGLIAGPMYYAYAKDELKAKGLV